jgi:flagellar biosynthetic protein FlhB
MSDSHQDRSEAATPKRRADAHEKGQVPKSQELTTAILLLAAAGMLKWVGPSLAGAMAELLHESGRIAVSPPRDAESVAVWMREVGWRVFIAVGPLMAGLAIAGSAVAGVQARGVFSAKPVMPDWSRIAPSKNIANIWGTRSLVEFGKSVVKLLVIAFAMYGSLRDAWPEIMTLGQQDSPALVRLMGHYAIRLLATAGAAFLVLAAADYAYQLWSHEKRLRMTKEEVKQESKESDGDPMIKSRIRSLARQRIRRQMFKDVPTADVVVTNPTHIAVALRYDPEKSPAPIVLAMGERKIAQRIKKLALESGVPVIENKPLARALLATGRVGLPIPADLYVAVAEVLAFVIKRRESGAMNWAGSAVV